MWWKNEGEESWNEKGKKKRRAGHKTPNLSANKRRAGLAKSLKIIF